MSSPVLEISAHKSVDSVVRQFRARMRQEIRTYCSGGSTHDLLQSNVRTLITDAVSDAYYEGLRSGGVGPEDWDEDNSQEADNLVADQMDYVDGFVQAIQDGCDNLQSIYDRVDLWMQSVAAAGQVGLNEAKAAEMVVWHLGNTEQHCATCSRLDGQRHRRSWFVSRDYIPQKPGAAMDCGGWNCDCSLETD